MQDTVIITFIGPDRPGLVEQLSETVSRHHGNWLESRLAHLAGQFAGVIRIQVPAEHRAALENALTALGDNGLTVLLQAGHTDTDAGATREYRLALLGPDRPGIVREVSQALGARTINVEELASNVSSAPMSGEPLFEASARIRVPASVDMDNLQDTLDAIADRLCLEIGLTEAEG